MSEGHQLYTNDDGSHILYDPNTGKYYTLMVDQHNLYQQNYRNHPANSNYFQEKSHIQMDNPTLNRYYPLQTQSNLRTTYPGQQTQTKARQPRGLNQNQKQTEPAATCRNISSHTNPLSAHNHQATPSDNTNTTLQTEQEQEDEGEEDNETTQSDSAATTIVQNKRVLNDSDDFTVVESNKTRKKTRNKETNSPNANLRTTTAQTEDGSQNKYNISLDHLQRAVSHNLPCFSITFDQTENLPSVVTAVEELYDHFERKHIQLNNNFSIVRYTGNMLKVGVKNKADYQTLCNTKIWPTTIQNNRITVLVPKFTPEQFSLVVRFIPPELPMDLVAKEIKRAINTADNFRKITYPYARKTNDYRFTVADIKEYNGLLRLGNIGIGNKMRTVTPYKPANKLAYCSKCWLLGHLRHQCQQNTQKCRFCLLNYDENHNEICLKQYNCAQCKQEHFSLDPDCAMVQQYRSNLNTAVKQAVQDGVIRLTPVEANPRQRTPPPKADAATFPPLPASTSDRINTRSNHWKANGNNSNSTQLPNDISNKQLFEKLSALIEEKTSQQSEKLVNMEQRIGTNEMKTRELHRDLVNVLDTIKILVHKVVVPLSKSTQAENDGTVRNTEEILSKLNIQMNELQNKLILENNQPVMNNNVTNDQVQVEPGPPTSTST